MCTTENANVAQTAIRVCRFTLAKHTPFDPPNQDPGLNSNRGFVDLALYGWEMRPR